jgi:gliding motility-associated-like protein
MSKLSAGTYMKTKTTLFFRILLAMVTGLLGPACVHSQTVLPANQPEQNACTALSLCGGSFYTPYSYQGTGAGVDLAATPCATPAETNTMWIKVTIANPGTLAFKIIPVDSADDYDFAVLDITNTGCSNLTVNNVVRCNYNNDEPGSNPGGIVGLNDTATNPEVQGGVTGWSFAQDIQATAGQTFLILINNFGHDSDPGPSLGFTIDFTLSTATFQSNTPPAFQSIVKQCSNSSVTIQLNQPILCSSIAADGSQFSIPGIAISGATGVNCVNGNGYTSQVTINFAGPYPPGNYTMNGQTGSTGTTLKNLCGDAMTQGTTTTSIAFTIPPAASTVFLPPDTTKCDYSTIAINATPGYAGYLWNNNDTTSSIAVINAGTYTLQITDTNGCKATDSIVITDSTCPQYVYLPNAFTPNNDGHNDIFKPVFAGAVSEFRFAVYDRWGRLMFQSSNPSSGWDGTLGGREQPAGAYVWECIYRLYDRPERMQRGTVMLIR